MEKVAASRLQPGMFISIAELGWLNHPFLLNEFRIVSDKQVQVLRRLGLKEIYWDNARSHCGPLSEEEKSTPTEEDFGALALTGMLDEKRSRISQVKEIRETFARREREYEKDSQTVGEIIKNLAGHPLESYAQAKTLVSRVVGNLSGSENAAIQLVHNKARDAALPFHSLNVMVMTLLLGKALKSPEEELRWLGLGALLHDVGKAEIPPRILRTTVRTPPEENFYRAHIGYGIKLVAGVRDLPLAVKNIIACHHENHDGSGFPNTLTGDKIPRLARIVAIANRYDNLCNPFDITLAKTPAEAVAQLFKQESGRFQPDLLQAFIKALGVYPPGSFVELSNGAIGLVIETNSANILQPQLMLYDAEVPRNEAILLDLRDADLKITAAISPAKLPLEVVEYLAPRGRIDYYIEGAR